MNKRERVRAQVKSRWYYSFWGIATVAVVSGQLYVGTSYRAMAKSMNRWFEETIDIITPKPQVYPKGFYQPMPLPKDLSVDY